MKNLFFIILFVGSVIAAFSQSKSDIEIILDEWAYEEFDYCFTGRTYKGISVSEFRVDDYNNKIEVKGYVSYLNLLDISVRYQFNATIKIYSSNRFKMTFNKYDGFSDEWETCERTYSK